VAADLVETAERIAAEQASLALERTVQEARDVGVAVQSCAVVVGRFPAQARLESILASHALAHAAEGRLYQRALQRGAESCGLPAIAIPKRSIWDEAETAFGVPGDELHRRIDQLRREIGPPWAEDQKLAALAAWIALAQAPGGIPS
jgi:nucleotide-binding universal stress UspA family protein